MNKKILMYHSIGTKAVKNREIGTRLYCVSEDNFRKQIEYLYINHPSAVITFDDGCIDNHTHAYSILKEAGFRGYFFILASRISTPGYMNWEHIKELKDAGMVIGSHGMTHKILTELSSEELDCELKESKRILEDGLKSSIDYFSIPRGFYNKKIIEKAKGVGYKAVFTSDIKDFDGFKFGRIPIKGSWDLDYFIRVINNGFPFKDRVKESMKNSAKNIFGHKNYDRIRAKILK